MKIANHKYSEKSKFPNAKEPTPAHAEKGDFVFLKEDGSKHKLRDTYVVLECKGDKVILTKMLHALNKNEQTKLSSKKIEVYQNEVYKSNTHNKEKYNEGEEVSKVTKNNDPEVEKPELDKKQVV